MPPKRKTAVEESEEVCGICFETFTTRRKKIKCQFCEFIGCSECIRRYLVESTEDPHCAECRREWTREFLHSTDLPKTFITTDLKNHREDVLADREKSLLPATQPIVEQLMEGNRIRAEVVGKLEAEKRTIIDEMSKIQARLYALNMQISKATAEADRLTWTAGTKPVAEAERRQFVRACPATDCRGFLSTAWKCGICETWVCPECREIKGKNRDDAHTCNPEILASIKMLEADSKHCPKCATLIFRVEGCDQMWCTSCQTAFSWSTGRVETGRIHNPHFFQWQRNNAAQAEAAFEAGGCGGVPTLSSLLRGGGDVALGKEYVKLVSIVHQSINDIVHRVLPTYPVPNVVIQNQDLRVKYLMNEISLEAWKKQLQQREKEREKRHDIRAVIEMFSAVATEYLQKIGRARLTDGAIDVDQVIIILVEMDKLRTYFNTQMEIISKRYGCVVPALDEKWRPSRM